MQRRELIKQYPWLASRGLPMLVSADLEGLLCAALLHHHMGWKLAGLDDGSRIWIDQANSFDGAVGVNLVSPRKLPGISHRHASSLTHLKPGDVDGLEQRLGAFPFSTPLFLLWLYDLPIRRELTARLLLLSVGETWYSAQSEPDRVSAWLEEMPGYDWRWLLAKIGTATLERRLNDQLLTPLGRLIEFNGATHLDAVSINPDWDTGAILNYFAFVGTWLKWSPPLLPPLSAIDGKTWSPVAGQTAQPVHDSHLAR